MQAANAKWRARVEAQKMRKTGKAQEAQSIASERRFAEATRYRVGRLLLRQVHVSIKGYALSLGEAPFLVRGFLGTEEELRQRVLFGGRGATGVQHPGLLSRLLQDSSRDPVARGALERQLKSRIGSGFSSRVEGLGERLSALRDALHSLSLRLGRQRRSPQPAAPRPPTPAAAMDSAEPWGAERRVKGAAVLGDPWTRMGGMRHRGVPSREAGATSQLQPVLSPELPVEAATAAAPTPRSKLSGDEARCPSAPLQRSPSKSELLDSSPGEGLAELWNKLKPGKEQPPAPAPMAALDLRRPCASLDAASLAWGGAL
ncbi:hypothetical protein EMIHUDRAFT_451479 [Emiliania huxleyi CCMP1516]|uniref:Uncharacterized protein n=2 Tax=Emiliania huxleyi TaxID=2903 RepID=A0A0D3J004_EMIH1|nr:hypothetical protein EMIHUDRAFT_451479 [Emiliania huxleyi CCMP1516]EOD16839.1 hypothetical protein EMIHUDRAFT_451479 [Emiliania huxleyi CCMP1516]|eukprot:XP_005769268.1 hypothetical protein EMIHUDRAFT_451479 [Emiliania huxleyi CCMP1516]